MVAGMVFIGGLAAAVVLLMVVLVVIAYMASKLLHVPELEVFAKIELYEVFISILILLSAEGFLLFSGNLSNIIAGVGTGETVFDYAREFHSRVIIQGVYPAVSYSYFMINLFSVLNTFQIRPNDSVWTWTYKVAPASDLVVGVFNLLVYGLLIVMTSLNAHMFILAFIQSTMQYFFLPAGVLLRFFPPTRKAGVFLIVLAIGFYSVYPTMYAIHLKALDQIAQIDGGDPNAHFDPFSESKAYSLMAVTVSTPFVVGSIASSAGAIPSSIPGAALLQSFVGFMASETFMMTLQPQLFSPVITSIASLSLVTFFLPALSMIATIAFINGVTNFIERVVT